MLLDDSDYEMTIQINEEQVYLFDDDSQSVDIRLVVWPESSLLLFKRCFQDKNIGPEPWNRWQQ